MTIRPLDDRLLTRLVSADNVSKGGIVLAPSAKEEQQVAEILAIGPCVKSDLHIGQRVVYGKYVGTEFSNGGEKQIIVRESDILAIIESESNEY